MREAASVNWGTAGGRVRTAALQISVSLQKTLCGCCCCWWLSAECCVLCSVFIEKFWFCRLSLNHKVLHYGDLDESPQGEVPFELLSDKSKKYSNFFFPLHLASFQLINVRKLAAWPCDCLSLEADGSVSTLFLSSPSLRHQVCADGEGLPSYEGEERSKAKQGIIMNAVYDLWSCMVSLGKH